jgi:hypothetical protein
MALNLGPTVAILPWTALAAPLAVCSLAALRLRFSIGYAILTMVWAALVLGAGRATDATSVFDGLSFGLGLTYVGFPLLITVHGMASWLRGGRSPRQGGGLR